MNRIGFPSRIVAAALLVCASLWAVGVAPAGTTAPGASAGVLADGAGDGGGGVGTDRDIPLCC